MSDMATWMLPLITVAAAQWAVLLVPGPNMVLVAHLAFNRSSRAAFLAGLGFAAIALVWSIAAFAGLAVLLHQVAWLVTGIKFAGGLYLAWLGFQLWSQVGKPTIPRLSSTPPFLIGVLTSFSNPKTILFFSSIFALAFPAVTPLPVKVAAVLMIVANELLYYGTLIVLLSRPIIQAWYRRCTHIIERFSGAILILFGIRLMWSGATEQ